MLTSIVLLPRTIASRQEEQQQGWDRLGKENTRTQTQTATINAGHTYVQK